MASILSNISVNLNVMSIAVPHPETNLFRIFWNDNWRPTTDIYPLSTRVLLVNEFTEAYDGRDDGCEIISEDETTSKAAGR